MHETRRLADGREVPVIPARQPRPPTDPNPTVAVCGLCDREIKVFTLSACQRGNCPLRVAG